MDGKEAPNTEESRRLHSHIENQSLYYVNGFCGKIQHKSTQIPSQDFATTRITEWVPPSDITNKASWTLAKARKMNEFDRSPKHSPNPLLLSSARALCIM